MYNSVHLIGVSLQLAATSRSGGLKVVVDLQAFICQEGRLHKNKYASLRRANLSCRIKLQKHMLKKYDT